jgi:chromosomal replication initiation ATPase DnaA
MVITTNTMEGISPYVVPGIKFEYMPSIDQWHKAERIMDKISEVMDIPLHEIKGDKRNFKIAMARQLCGYFIKLNTSLPLTEIGKVMGGFHHTSIIHSIRKVKDQISSKANNQIRDYHDHLIKVI